MLSPEIFKIYQKTNGAEIEMTSFLVTLPVRDKDEKNPKKAGGIIQSIHMIIRFHKDKDPEVILISLMEPGNYC